MGSSTVHRWLTLRRLAAMIALVALMLTTIREFIRLNHRAKIYNRKAMECGQWERVLLSLAMKNERSARARLKEAESLKRGEMDEVLKRRLVKELESTMGSLGVLEPRISAHIHNSELVLRKTADRLAEIHTAGARVELRHASEFRSKARDYTALKEKYKRAAMVPWLYSLPDEGHERGN